LGSSTTCSSSPASPTTRRTARPSAPRPHTLPDDPTDRLIVVCIDNQPIGDLIARCGGASGRHAGSLESLAVLPEYRSRGLARPFARLVVDDRDAVRGRATPLWAAIRIYRDGGIDLGSCRAPRHVGFPVVGEGCFGATGNPGFCRKLSDQASSDR
jgi:ribosomal protein S18 acetylase RimI-like enzyme